MRNSILEIQVASKRAAEIADQMLAYSGKGLFVTEAIDLATLLRGMSHLLAVSISKKIEFRTQFAGDLPTIKGDITQLRQIILNLILNAAEAIGERTGVITLSTGLMKCDRAYLDAAGKLIRAKNDQPPPEGSYVYFEVSDTGSGMTAATMEKIFDPFFTTKFTGRGLGLAAAQGIVRGHRGVIEIQSEVGKGTTFKVLFPAGKRQRSLGVVQAGGETEPEVWRGSGTVLFVDDVEEVRAAGQRMLEHIGFGVITAAGGQEAVEVLRQHADEIVCVLLDLTMPGLDGREAFQEMCRLHPDIPVILCSGYTEHSTAREFAGRGLAGFLKKPFDLRGLRRKLKQVLEKPDAGP
ncbi:MAG: response regulator [Planctomycetota bacterium]